MRRNQPYQHINVTPWPFTVSLSLIGVVIGVIMSMNNKIGSKELIIIAIISLIYSIMYWFYEILIESTYKGEHTKSVQKNYNYGLIIFVISEVIVFGCLFLSLFYIYYIPQVELNYAYIPEGIKFIDYTSIPLLNTALLFFGSISITATIHAIVGRKRKWATRLLISTILFNIFFTYLQFYEYYNSQFTITDSYFGSIFYFLTGTHSLHVIIGTVFLIFTQIRLSLNHFTNTHHILSSFSSLYYHFLDIVWLFLFAFLYILLPIYA